MSKGAAEADAKKREKSNDGLVKVRKGGKLAGGGKKRKVSPKVASDGGSEQNMIGSGGVGSSMQELDIRQQLIQSRINAEEEELNYLMQKYKILVHEGEMQTDNAPFSKLLN